MGIQQIDILNTYTYEIEYVIYAFLTDSDGHVNVDVNLI